MFDERIGLSCEWVVKERHGGLWVPVLRVKNLVTTYGLTHLASAWGGTYVAPQWLAVDTDSATLSAGAVLGATSISTNKRVDLAGDTQLHIAPGTASAEKVTFSAVSGTGPYTYTLSAATTFAHSTGDAVVRAVSASDGLSTLVSEGQYDSAAAPNARMPETTGYSPANGQWTHQFYFTGTQAIYTFNTLALMDSPTIGQGNMHNHFVLGYVHPSGTDVEIDGTLTITNN